MKDKEKYYHDLIKLASGRISTNKRRIESDEELIVFYREELESIPSIEDLKEAGSL